MKNPYVLGAVSSCVLGTEIYLVAKGKKGIVASVANQLKDAAIGEMPWRKIKLPGVKGKVAGEISKKTSEISDINVTKIISEFKGTCGGAK